MPHRLKLSIIMPTLNEVENIAEMYRALRRVVDPLKMDYEFIFVDDYSQDGSLELFKRLHDEDPNLKYIIMSRRFGDQTCLMAGLKAATGDVAITMDADLQHPPEYIPEMIEKWKAGAEVIIMKREEAGHNSSFKKWTEILFYKTLATLTQTSLVYRFAGFALMDSKVVSALNRFEETDPFLRGLVALVGFRRIEMTYKERERKQGRSKYFLREMLRLAITGLTSFSVLPLYFAFGLGTVSIALALVYAIYVFGSVVIESVLPPGWASVILSVLFLGGVQLFTIGIVGIYLGKIFVESKRRPNYIIADSAGFDD